jgi:O-antigen ligase
VSIQKTEPVSQSFPEAESPGRFTIFLIVCEWLFLLTAVGLWTAFKSYNPLMNAGVGLWAGTWVARWLRTGHLSRLTPIDTPMLGFILSILIAQWVAPIWTDGIVRLFLLLGAIGLFYTLANSSLSVLNIFCFGFVGVSAILGLYFASQNPWADQPAKFALLQTIGLWLNAHVPTLGLYDPHPNVVAGFLAVATGVGVALFWQRLLVWRQSSPGARVYTTLLGGIGLILLFGLIMTQSRAGWLAVAGAVALGGGWWLAGSVARLIHWPQWAIFWMGAGFGLGIALGLVLSKPQLLTVVLGTLPGPNSSVSRVEIYGQVWRLAQDTPFTGGGLASFPGLYSTFVLSVPPLFLTHAHNSYLNLLVEQGWLGAGAYIVSLALLVWFGLWRLNSLEGPQQVMAAAGLIGVAVVLLNGLADATLVASRIAPAVFIPAGLALCGNTRVDLAWKPSRWWLIPVVMAVAMALVFYKPLEAQWHANIGALNQNRVALENWPTGEWDDGSKLNQLEPAEQEFQKALAIDPENYTAIYRTGLLAMTRQDFGGAASLLQRAYDVDPSQRVIIKSLGYAYVWQGDFEHAQPLLNAIPEANSELVVYAWWWQNKFSRTDLAQDALTMLKRMS